jgi:hypothetical protein
MRKQTVIKIDAKEITIREITVKEIRAFWQEFESHNSVNLEDVYGILKRFIPTCMFGIGADDIEDMAPSEIKMLYDAFTEVNDVFFNVARQIQGENPILVGLRQALIPLLMMRFAGLFQPVTEESLSTDMDSSFEPSGS